MNKRDQVEIHAKALREFDRIQEAMREVRMSCLEDRRFYSIPGAQWEGALGSQFENKPKFEINKIHMAVIRIINEYRNNQISVNFIAKDGSPDDQLSETLNSLYRADEADSSADEAYGNAFEEAVAGGFGAWRLRTYAEEEDESDEEEQKQRIRIETITDADSCVFFDLNSKRQDKSDARYCFVLTAMTRDAYEETYNDSPSSWPRDVYRSEYDWDTPDLVYVAEYYRVEEKTEKVHVFASIPQPADPNLTGIMAPPEQPEQDVEEYTDEELDIETETLLLGQNKIETRAYTSKKRKIHKYILSGGGILEDCGYIAGNNIPIVPVYGKRWFVDGVERCMGHVRLAKDAQRLWNMQLSRLGELAAVSVTEKPILMPEQVAGHQLMWSSDNINNYPYLLVNPITDASGQIQPAGPVGYTKPPSMPPTMTAILQVVQTDLQELMGNQQQADKMVSNISGKAVEMIQERIDMQAYIYLDNMKRAMRRSGEIWLGMAKDILVEPGRKLLGMGAQGQNSQVELYKLNVHPKTNDIYYQNNISEANHYVAVDVGPSFASKKAATVRALTGMLTVTQDQEAIQILTALSLMNMEAEGISDIRDYYRRKLVMAGIVKPNEQESQEMQAAQQQQQQKQDPNAIYLEAAAQEAMARADKARADTVLTAAKAVESKAKTIETLAGIDLKERQQLIDVAAQVGEAFGVQKQQQQQPTMGMQDQMTQDMGQQPMQQDMMQQQTPAPNEAMPQQPEQPQFAQLPMQKNRPPQVMPNG